MFVREEIPNLLNDMNDDDPDAYCSKVDESHDFPEYGNFTQYQDLKFDVHKEFTPELDYKKDKF